MAGVRWGMARDGVRIVLLVLLVLLVAGPWGCSAGSRRAAEPAAASFVVGAGDYALAFEAARAELLRRRFEIERVDAQAGVIVTRPTGGAGLLAPWTLGPSSRLAEDTLNAQSRTIEVRFEAAETLDQLPPGTPDALADPGHTVPPGVSRGSVVVSVRVLISRRVSATRRLEPTGIRFSSSSLKPELFQRGLGTVYLAPRDLDSAASARLARSIEQRLARGSVLSGGRGDTQGGTADQGGPGPDAQLAVQ